MDASAYLRKQGWRGEGHSLDHTDRGIKRPLLVSKKVDVLGVGLNKHTSVSDQWWLRAFDQGLKNLGSGQEISLAQIQKHGVYRGGLYANFVKGEKLEGSIGNSLLPTPDTTSETDTESSSEQESTSEMAASSIPPEGESRKRKALHEPDEKATKMARVPGKKRTRDENGKLIKERPKEVRARRKQERSQKLREKMASMPPKEVDPAQAEAKRIRESVDRRAATLVREAQRRGIIPQGPQAPHRGRGDPGMTGANATPMSGNLDADLQEVVERAGLQDGYKPPKKGGGSEKTKKLDRLKVTRELKRAAKAYIMSQETPQAHEALAAQKEREKEKRRERRLKEEQKKAAVEQVEAEKKAVKAARKARHKERRDASRAARDAVTIAEYQEALANGEKVKARIVFQNIPPKKLERYRERASEKGMDLEQYILRREEKAAAKRT
ncbi:uncharacterized protein LTR77_004354 [Saxophila tyrrhenica]|uniref:Uncharacterized protein n=1 Tax=Saxophila tyrrhenica TaxID=1690608 RepID=A0AAV9PD91_9PEZI|nr:hypothetical protein LTR77_004354 [Saxophila tyrrhenica]